MYSSEHPYRAYQVMEYIETYFRMFFAVTVLTVVSDVKDFIFLVVIVTVLNWLAGYMAFIGRNRDSHKLARWIYGREEKGREVPAQKDYASS